MGGDIVRKRDLQTRHVDTRPRESAPRKPATTIENLNVDPRAGLIRVGLDVQPQHGAAIEARRRHPVDEEVCFSTCPPVIPKGRSALPNVPARAERHDWRNNDVGFECRNPADIVDAAGPIAPVQAQLVRPAIEHLFLERAVDRKVGMDVMAIDAVDAVRRQPTRCQVRDQLIREDDVDVRAEHETTSGAP